MRALEMFKKTFRIAKPDIWLVIGSVITLIIASSFEVFGVSLAIPIVNSLAAGGDFLSNLKAPFLGNIIKLLPLYSNLQVFIFLILLILISTYLSAGLIIRSVFLMSRFTTNLQHSLRTRIFSKYLSYGKAFYDKSSLGSLTSVMINTTTEFGSIMFGSRYILVYLILGVAFFVFLLAISWKLTLLMLPLVAFIFYPLNGLIKRLRASAQKKVSTSIDLNSYVTDILSNMLLVKSYANERAEVDKITKKSDKVRFHSYNVAKNDGSIPWFTEAISTTGFIALVCICVIFYLGVGNFSLGRFLVYFFALRRFLIYIKPVNELKGLIAKASPVMEKILWVFDDTDKPYIKNGNIEFANLKEKIEFKNIDFRYIKERQILKNINFIFKRGKSIALVGPTGSGKTTIAYLLCRFYDCESGCIEIDGVDIRNFTFESLRKKIAIVSQDTMLLNDTIRNNITYGIQESIPQEELDAAAKKAYIYDFIMGLPNKYETYIGDRGVRLSGGERQRISIARAILKNADILILDEATSALDTETEMLIQQAISNLIKEKTVLAIAHRLSTIKNADWIMVLEDGQITEQGRRDELLDKKGRFFHYWGLQKFY